MSMSRTLNELERLRVSRIDIARALGVSIAAVSQWYHREIGGQTEERWGKQLSQLLARERRKYSREHAYRVLVERGYTGLLEEYRVPASQARLVLGQKIDQIRAMHGIVPDENVELAAEVCHRYNIPLTERDIKLACGERAKKLITEVTR